MTRTIRRAARLGSLILATVAIAAIAPAAHADTAPLDIDFIYCESGVSSYACYAVISGGVGPVTESWSPAAIGRCIPKTRVKIALVATDSTGASVTQSLTFNCTGLPWP